MGAAESSFEMELKGENHFKSMHTSVNDEFKTLHICEDPQNQATQRAQIKAGTLLSISASILINTSHERKLLIDKRLSVWGKPVCGTPCATFL